jgi:hypothetical protein
MVKLAAVLALLLVSCIPTAPTTSTPDQSPAAVLSPSASPSPRASICHVTYEGLNPLPDPNCTPGATNPAVTQATIQQTICTTGYTAKIRPLPSYTEPLKRRSIVDYGYADTNPSDYEFDHFIPLEVGGAPSNPQNLWAEPGRSPNPKDAIENTLRRRVCTGVMTLADAQQRIMKDWPHALD